MPPLWWQNGRCTGDDGPKGCQEGTQGDAGLWSLVALSPEGQGVPPTHPSPNTCKKSHVSPGSCPPSGVGAGGLPLPMALSASTQSCSRGPTALKSPAKGGGCPAPRLQAQQGELRQVPCGTHPLGSATPCPVHPWWHLDGPGRPGGPCTPPSTCALVAGRAGLQCFRLSPKSHVSAHECLAPKPCSPLCPMAHHALPGRVSLGSFCCGAGLAPCHSWVCGDKKGTGGTRGRGAPWGCQGRLLVPRPPA